MSSHHEDRHAFLIIAHDRPEELSRLMAALDDPRNDLYVHIDRKSDMEAAGLSAGVKHGRVRYIDRTTVVWGGSSQVKVELDLFEAAVNGGEYRYFHLLSGVDYPVKSNDYIHDYCRRHDGLNFISVERELPRQRMRFDQYHLLQNTLVGKKRNVWKYLDFASCMVQEKIGVHRYKGDATQIKRFINWVSVTDDVARMLVERKQQILRQYRFTYCCDEIFLLEQMQRAGLADTLAPQGNLRFIEWTWMSKHDSSPRVLTLDDLPELKQPDVLFARKFNLPQSTALYAALDKECGRA